MTMIPSTIVALATAPGSGGIGIVKISGRQACRIARSLFRPSRPRGGERRSRPPGFDPASHRLYHGCIVDPSKDEIVDEVLLVVMRGPRSYTREDVVEIQAHGSQAALNRIVQLVLEHGARPAEPGEFTKRAFLNGRIDLTQAEAVMDLIQARSETALQLANRQMAGGMGTVVEGARQKLLDIVTAAEAAIDFPDELEAVFDPPVVISALKRLVSVPLQGIVKQYPAARIYREGAAVVIAGCPNVGKSSLMNRMVNQDRSIVTALPGTTRDIVEAAALIKGVPVTFTDTAGIHATDDPVEKIGIQKARQELEAADAVLFMIDAGAPIGQNDHDVFESIRHKPLIVVINKRDLVPEGAQLELPSQWQRLPHVETSALNGTGLAALSAALYDLITAEKGALDERYGVAPNFRQKQLLEKALGAVRQACRGLEDHWPVEVVVLDLKEAQEALAEVLGLALGDDVLDRVFSRFCVGK